MNLNRRRMLTGSLGFGAAVLGGGVAGGTQLSRTTGLTKHYRAWLAAVERVATADARRVSVMDRVGRETLGRHYAGMAECAELREADRICDEARAERDRIEEIIAQLPAASEDDAWVKQQVVRAYAI